MLKVVVAVGAALLLFGLPARQGQAGSYPTKPVMVVVPYGPGSQPDTAMRLISDRLSAAFGQRFVIENKLGASGNTGSAAVAAAKPDGHTLVAGSVSSHGVNPSLYADMPYDAVKDFAPIAVIAQAPSVLVAHPSVPAKTFDELIAYIKANPGQLNYASPGAGTLNRLIMETIKKKFSLDLPGIPYRGSVPALTDVVAGHVKVVFTNVEIGAPMIREGKVKAFAVGSERRSDLIPDVPTFIELGYPDLTSTVWSALFAPAGTPQDIVANLNKEVLAALASPEATKVLENLGIVVPQFTPEQTEQFVKTEIQTLGMRVKQTGIKLD